MKSRNMIITVILIITVFTIGTSTFLLNQSQAATINNTITQQGTKLNLKNNNNQEWEHMHILIQNITTSNGSKQNYYIETWIKPGENTTIDLSNILGYGNHALTPGTNINILSWSGLYSTDPGTGDFSLSLQGWSNTTTPPVNATIYHITQGSIPVSTLPSSITGTIALIGTNPSDVTVTGENNANDVLFKQIQFTIDPNGNIIITFPTPPTLCNTIAQTT
jgi:hypothetical protein